MRTLWWVVLFVVGLCGIIIPVTYFYYASGLPNLDSEFDLEKLMKLTIEGERMSLKMGMYTKDKGGVEYERPDFTKLPKDWVALYISQMNCPTYFQTPREEGLKWAWRMYGGVLFKTYPEGDGRCERYLALRIAQEIGIKGGMEQTIAASRMHTFLQKDQLLAYELSGTIFARAIVGPDAAARDLFGRPLEQLQLAELAELAVAMPLNGYWDDAKACRNPSLLRQYRDNVLGLLAMQSLVTAERAKSAQAQPLGCTRTP